MFLTRSPQWHRADLACSSTSDWEDVEPCIEDLLEEGWKAPSHYFGPDWHRQSLCGQLDGTPEEIETRFFGARDTTERPALSMNDLADAKKVCAECPVFRTCLEEALGATGGPRNEYGIWAGTSGRTRRRIWELVDNGGADLSTIVNEICAGQGEKYERSVTKVAFPQVIPLPRPPLPEELDDLEDTA